MIYNGMLFDGKELKVVFDSLDISKLAMDEALEQDDITEEEKVGIREERDLAHNMMVRIGEYWAREERWDLTQKAEVLFDKWQQMSDAKSNGVCAEMSIREVCEYDDKMVAPLYEGRKLKAQADAITPRYK